MLSYGIYWYCVADKPCAPMNADWEAEAKWAENTGFSKHCSFGYVPFDLPRLLNGKKRRPVNGVELPCALDYLIVYMNPKTKQKVAIFHEYPCAAQEKIPILEKWCNENSLILRKMSYSWYNPGITTAYMIEGRP